MNAEDYSERGDKYFSERNFDKAIEDFTEVIRLEPNNPFAFCKRGMSYTNNKEYDLAISDLTEAICIEPNKFGGFYFERALAYIAKGDNSQAILDLEMAVKIDPKNKDYCEALSDAKAGNSGEKTGRKKKLIIMVIGFVIGDVIGIILGLKEGNGVGFGLITGGMLAFFGIGLGPIGTAFVKEIVGWLKGVGEMTKDGFNEGLGQAFWNLILSFVIFGIWHYFKFIFKVLISPFVAIYQLVTNN
jgi:tetratricopeptide (TPR) repeat protein